jgi:hypothetical protein
LDNDLLTDGLQPWVANGTVLEVGKLFIVSGFLSPAESLLAEGRSVVVNSQEAVKESAMTLR